MPRRYVIIGAGAAGIAAATSLRGIDPAGDITVVTDDPHGYYSRPGLAYYLTGELPERQLFPFKPDELKQLDLGLCTDRAVTLDLAGHRVLLEDGETLPYDRLLLATGSTAAPPSFPGGHLAGVVKLDSLSDARQIIQGARRARAAVVVGGGITALEIVEGLRHHCREVHYLLRGDRYWGNVLDETESGIVEGRLQAEHVKLHYHTEIASAEGRGGRVAGVVTKAGERIPCELLGVAIGVLPNVELARAAGLRMDRGVLVNEFLQTSDPHVYAAGDVAQVFDPLTGRAALDTLWNVALDQGRAAAANMAGVSTPYVKAPPLNVTRLAGITTTIIGTVGHGRDAGAAGDLVAIARGDSETWRGPADVIAAESTSEVNRLRVLIGTATLVGAIVMGDQALSRPLQDLVGRQVDITPIRDALLSPDAVPQAILASFWETWRRAHAA
jgi:NADPH-dependent 2,4-dienoyl-CoA reductase/sulfur reductase-like enzyme